MTAPRHRLKREGSVRTYEVVRRDARYWSVIADDGTTIRTYTKADDAQAAKEALERKQRPQARRRPCMCCQRPFMSEGIHHRLCNGCRTSSLGADFSSGGSGGRVRPRASA